MRKTILFLMVVVMALSLMGGLALAGGWTTISYTRGQATDLNYWEPDVDGSPHGNFSATSNKCRVCHAVHLATGSTWRLLNGATDAKSECNGCHGPGGLTDIRPYDDVANNLVVRGEHRLKTGPQVIPDALSGEDTITGGLICNTCHSVHGANTLSDNTPEAYAVTTWDGKILRKDPNADGTDLGVGDPGASAVDTAGASNDLNDSSDAVKSAFCADCHNKNPNWGDNAETNEAGGRANGTSHIQGPTAQGKLKIGNTDTSVAGFSSATYTAAPRGQTTTEGCRACHSASDAGNNVVTGNTRSAFPHRTTGSKLLYDGFAGDASDVDSQTGSPIRALAQMDSVCGGCHDADGDLSTATTGSVGQGF